MTDLERLQHENAQLNRQVTDLQRRCTELLEEKRRAYIDYAVREFHLKYGHPAPVELVVPDDATIRFRFRLIAEEFLELIEAAFQFRTGVPLLSLRGQLAMLFEVMPIKINLPEFMDATHDLDYVVSGTRVVFGYDGLPGAAEVHRANMSKDPNGPDGKPVKPPDWRGPDIEGVLRAQIDLATERRARRRADTVEGVFADVAKTVRDDDTVSLSVKTPENPYRCEEETKARAVALAALSGSKARRLFNTSGDSERCRRKIGHQGPHSFSLDAALKNELENVRGELRVLAHADKQIAAAEQELRRIVDDDEGLELSELIKKVELDLNCEHDRVCELEKRLEWRPLTKDPASWPEQGQCVLLCDFGGNRYVHNNWTAVPHLPGVWTHWFLVPSRASHDEPSDDDDINAEQEYSARHRG